ncbi:MAG: hypothetical protein GX782_01760 [Gammaproteobacteria bacterium]|nr:hypothetical protein [Gammaproteobacteria bacterium]
MTKIQESQGFFYHGTKDSLTIFDLDHQNRKNHGWLGTDIYTGSDKRLAGSYARLKEGSCVPQVMEFYANVRETLNKPQAIRSPW